MAVIVLYPMRETDYNAPVDYIMYKHKEGSKGDSINIRVYREEFSIIYMNSQGEIQPIVNWEVDIIRTNVRYGRSRGNDGITMFQYVLSFEPEDNVSLARAEYLGVLFAKTYLKGHQRLIGTHIKYNEEGKRLVHCHIYINAVRDVTLEIDTRWMSKNNNKEIKRNQYMEGLKHDPNRRWRAFLNNELEKFCNENGLTYNPKAKARDRVTYKERQIVDSGKVSHRRVIKDGIIYAAKSSSSIEQYVYALKRKNIKCEFRKEYPYYKGADSERWISARSLGTNYYWERVSVRIQANAIKEAINRDANKLELERECCENDALIANLEAALKYIQLIMICEVLLAEQEEAIEREKKELSKAISILKRHNIETYEEFQQGMVRSIDLRIILAGIKDIIERVRDLIKYITRIDKICESPSELRGNEANTTERNKAKDRNESR